MFIIDILNEFILSIFNHFITLNNIIMLLIIISTVLTIKEIEIEFNFQN